MPCGAQFALPGASCSSDGSTRTITTWLSAEPMACSGNTVSKPSSGTSSARTRLPFSVATRTPFAHDVWSNLLPGEGPSERIGTTTDAPTAPPAIRSVRRSNVLRSISPPREISAFTSAFSSGVPFSGSRWSSCWPSESKPLAHTIRPTPMPRNARKANRPSS